METPSGWVGSWDKAALDQFVEPSDEPVAWGYEKAKYPPNDLRGQQWVPALWFIEPHTDNGMAKNVTPLYTRAQPVREWVGLTDEEIETIWKKYKTEFFAIKEVEAKLKEKNT
jgi:hypothetical protein